MEVMRESEMGIEVYLKGKIVTCRKRKEGTGNGLRAVQTS